MPKPQTTVSFREDTQKAFSLGTAKFAVQVVTERGVANEPKEVRTEREFIRYFGQVTHPTAEEAVRALRKGAILIINPLYKFTAGETVGTKASVAITVGAETLTVTAKEVGEGYNGIVVKTSSPRSRKANVVDLKISKGTEFDENIYDVPVSLTDAEVININKKLINVSLSISATLTLTNALTGTLVSGVKDSSALLPADIVAAVSAAYQDFDFGEVFHLVNLYYTDFEVDAAFVALGEAKKLSVHLPLPLHVTVANAIAQREGTGTFTHQPINSLFAEYWIGQIEVRSIQDPTQIIDLHPMADIMAAITKKDAIGQWLSASAADYGLLDGDVLNARKFTDSELDQIYDAGINFISRKSGLGIKLNGNNSLFLDKSKLSSKRNIGDLTIYNLRWTELLGDKYLDKPADIQTIREIHREALENLNDLVARRAITEYTWVGDQEANTLDELVLNDKTQFQLGNYKVENYVVPTGSLEQIGIETVLTQGVSSASAVLT
ncbi:hypothetical protein [Bernardetia sp.]|uniref:hypothetical protein n=1 Tax=Bernardetia sp. TaxID=1937974 RepID=UPI0025C11915|nr:hypothetical protein [Bernardetia sp.]